MQILQIAVEGWGNQSGQAGLGGPGGQGVKVIRVVGVVRWSGWSGGRGGQPGWFALRNIWFAYHRIIEKRRHTHGRAE